MSKPSPKHLAWRRTILVLTAAALAGYHLVAANLMYPVPGGDAVAFVPPAVNLKAGRSLTNSLWTFQPDPLGKDRFYEHTPFFQLATSACMWRAETKTAFLVLAIFNVLSLWLYAAFLAVVKINGRSIVASRLFGLLVSSMFAVAFFGFNSFEGRPEALTTLLLCLALMTVPWMPRKWQPCLFGGLIGVTAAIHPTHGIFAACLAVLVFFLTNDLPTAIRRMVVAGTLALGLFWSLMCLAPYGLRQTLRALSAHAAHAYAPDYRFAFFAIYYVKLAPWSGLYLFAVFLLLAFCGWHIWKVTVGKTLLFFRFASLFLAVFVVWFFSIRSPNENFYIRMLAPALAAAGIYLFIQSSTLLPNWTQKPIISACWALTLLFTAFLARDIILFANYSKHGVSFVEAQGALRKLEGSHPPPIFVSESLWVLANDYSRIKIVERGSAAGEIMMVQQNGRQSLTPPTIPGYRAVLDRFVSYRPTLFGSPLGRTMPGYAFEIYQRDGR